MSLTRFLLDEVCPHAAMSNRPKMQRKKAQEAGTKHIGSGFLHFLPLHSSPSKVALVDLICH